MRNQNRIQIFCLRTDFAQKTGDFLPDKPASTDFLLGFQIKGISTGT